MTSEIIKSSVFIDSLRVDYGEFRMVTGPIGQWYYPKSKLFFECSDKNRLKCAENIFSNRDLDSMIVYFIVQGEDGYQLRDSRFKNIYGQTLERMISHYHMVLEPSIRHGLQVGGLKYVTCIGYGAIIELRKIDTVSNISEIKNILEGETKIHFKIESDKEKPEVKLLIPATSKENKLIEIVRISGDTLSIYAPKNTKIEKPNLRSGVDWENYLKKVAWKDAMSLPIREKYYGILVTFDAETTSFKVDLAYPIEEEKLRKACHALIESNSIE